MTKGKMRAQVYIQSEKQNSILRGHPWIFPKAISNSKGSLITGELVDIHSADGLQLGVGVYNEHSLYRVRVFALSSEQIDCSSLKSIVQQRLLQAMMLRNWLGLPNNETNAYRLFNSEADGLSGLTIDRFNNKCVVASSAFWVEVHKQIIYDHLSAMLPKDDIIWLPQQKPLTQDGWTNPESRSTTESTEVLEAGVRYQVHFASAQKTGLFIDQRENHQRIASLAQNKKVLDLYTYTGGFALHAALKGASEITAIDSSKQAIEQAKHNAALNGLKNIEFIEADARDYLNKAGEYDIVVLDPPKLVPSQRHLQKAKNYYRFLHREVFKYMRSGSLLMTCNCSSALSSNEFTQLVHTQALASGKQTRIVGVYGPASCHTILASFPEGNYLTAVLVFVI